MIGEVSLSMDLSVPKNAQSSSDIINNKDINPVSEQLIEEPTQIYIDSNSTNPESSTTPQPIPNMPRSCNDLPKISESPKVTQSTSR
jgi:hypothetical protein